MLVGSNFFGCLTGGLDTQRVVFDRQQTGERQNFCAGRLRHSDDKRLSVNGQTVAFGQRWLFALTGVLFQVDDFIKNCFFARIVVTGNLWGVIGSFLRLIATEVRSWPCKRYIIN